MDIRLQASETHKFSTQEEADHQIKLIPETAEEHSVALLADPLTEQVKLDLNLSKDKISYLCCCGDSDDSGAILDFSWVQDLRRQCIALDIPFYFSGTGANFRMRGRDFHIDKKFQESQARKADVNYFPLKRAMNPPSIGNSSESINDDAFLSSDHKSPSNGNSYLRESSTAEYGHSSSINPYISSRNASFDNLRKLGFRPLSAEDSSNPFLEDSTEENPFESALKSPSSYEQDETFSFSDSDLTIPHINYRIDIEDEPENEFAVKKEETLTIPGINYEVELENDEADTEVTEIDTGNMISPDHHDIIEAVNFSSGSQEELPEETLRNFKARNMDELFSHLARSKFRSGFHLHKLERDYFTSHGEETIRKHASDFIAQRLAPKEPANDGKQTPMKGHPVFIAQHATACCCRGCLKKWHHIPEHRELSQDEQNYVVNVIMKWIAKDMS